MKVAIVFTIVVIFFTSVIVSFLVFDQKQLQSSIDDDFDNISSDDLSLDRSNFEDQKQPELRIYAWLPWWEEERALQSMLISQDKLKIISPVWYQVDSKGQIYETASNYKSDILESAKKYDIAVIPTVSNAANGGFDPDRISLLLRTEEIKNTFSAKLIELASVHQYQGWDLDWEEINEADRDIYSDFLADLYKNCKEHQLILSVAIHAQTGKETDWIGVRGHDLRAISQSVDQVRIMAYDFHYSESPPGPITPMNQLIEVIEHNLTYIPKDKFVLGLPTYGYKWGESGGIPLQFYKIDQIITERKLTPSL